MFDRILVPLDGSPFSEDVLPLATSIARAMDARLTLLRVRRPLPVGYGQDSELAALDVDSTDHETAAAHLREVASRLGTATRVATVLLDDPAPASAICREAVVTERTLVVMSTHGRTGLVRAVRGSVADAVLRHATMPVLLWRPSHAHAGAASAAPDRLWHFLVALDGSPWAETVIPSASLLADAMGARLTLARIVAPVVKPVAVEMAAMAAVPFAGSPFVRPEVDAVATERELDRARAYLDRLAGRVRARHRGMQVGAQAVAGDDAGQGILHLATALGADVVALTTHGRGGSRVFLGSTVDRVLHGRVGATLVLRPSTPGARA